MANKRLIYQDFFEDDYFGIAELGLRLLWVGLITSAADDQGRVLDNSALIRAKVFMYDANITDEHIEGWLYNLNNDGKIIRYEVDGKKLIQIVNWWEYQIPSWATESKYPSPPDWTDRVRCHVKGNKIMTINWNEKGGFTNNQNQESFNDLTTTLNNTLSSDLCNDPDRPINEDKDKAKYKDEDECKDDLPKLKEYNDLFNSCLEIFETKKGQLVTDGPAFSSMIGRFIEYGVTAEDYSAAIDSMDADKKYKGTKPTSYETWAISNAERNKPQKQYRTKKHLSVEEQTNNIIRELIDGN
jgi:hypothetical protein